MITEDIMSVIFLNLIVGFGVATLATLSIIWLMEQTHH